MAGTPKLIFVDSGLAAHLTAGLVGDTQLGGLLESFALSELARQLTWSQASARLYHYRDRDRYEVDAILDNSAGEIIGVEVKAAETVRGDDFRGLRLQQRRLGSRFRAGFVLYCGTQQLPRCPVRRTCRPSATIRSSACPTPRPRPASPP